MLDELTEWGKSCGLKFNPDKSVAVVFTRRRKTPPFALRIDGTDIPFKQEVKYLGVTLDSKLHWRTHIKDRISKAKKFLTHVSYITKNNWGPKPKLMRWAYLAVVRPMLCYGALVWGHRAPDLAAELQRVNRMAINTFANFPKSTPTAALELMLDIMPIHLFCLQEALSAKVRLDDVLDLDWSGSNKNKLRNTSHLKYWEAKIDEHNIPINARDGCLHRKYKQTYEVNMDSFDGLRKHRHLSQYNVYTDGSSTKTGVGSGYAIFRRNVEISSASYHLPNYSTVFQAEIIAINRACRQLIQTGTQEVKYVKFFVDSQAAITALQNPIIKSRTVWDTVNLLEELADKVRRISIVWIPAHRGHVGNERADRLAKSGSDAKNAVKHLKVHQPTSKLRSNIRRAAAQEWKNEWTNLSTAHHARSFYSGPDHTKAKFVYGLARLELGRFVRIITGHNNLNFFQTKLGLWHDPFCRFCGSGLETITHLFSECPCFYRLRNELFLGSPPGPDMNWSVRTILEFSFSPRINAAFEGTWAHGDPPGANDLDDVTRFDSSQVTTTTNSDSTC